MNKITKIVDFDIAVDLVKRAKTNDKLKFYTDNVFTFELIEELVYAKHIKEVRVAISKNDYHFNKKFTDKTKNKRFIAVAQKFAESYYVGYKYYKKEYILSSKTIAKSFREKLENESRSFC